VCVAIAGAQAAKQQCPEAAFASWIASPSARNGGVGKTRSALVVDALAPVTGPENNLTLTARELQVLALLAEGVSNKLIGRRLGISAHTTKYHVAQWDCCFRPTRERVGGRCGIDGAAAAGPGLLLSRCCATIRAFSIAGCHTASCRLVA
jgi:hypothetical protein